MTTTRTVANPLRGRAPLALIVAKPVALTGVAADADAALGGAIARAVRNGEITGGAGETTVFHGATKGPTHVVVVGVGAGEAREDWRRAGAAIAKAAAARRASKLTLALPEGVDAADAEALLIGIAYAGYRFDRFRSKDGDAPAPVALEAVAVHGGQLSTARLAALDTIGARVAAARDLENTPGNHLSPPMLAAYAKDLARTVPGLSCTVYGPAQLAKMGAGALLAVAQGSANPAQLIVLRYRPERRTSNEVLGLVGKAVTFDSGGISIKPAGGMEDMKMDMGGGAAAIEGIAAIAQLGLPVETLAVIPSAENMPDGLAIKPGDVVTAMNGKTIEVINTDAEGRLILADALTWCARHGATRMLDLATLTGAMVVALGEVYAGLFGSDQEWTDAVRAAGEASGDLAWPMPLHEGYRPLITSSVADLSNAAKKRQAGAVYAAMFLREFTDGLPWCHLDIAGTGMVGDAGTGYGVRLIAELARAMA